MESLVRRGTARWFELKFETGLIESMFLPTGSQPAYGKISTSVSRNKNGEVWAGCSWHGRSWCDTIRRNGNGWTVVPDAGGGGGSPFTYDSQNLY